MTPGPWTLRDYAVVADGHRGALIDPHGGVAWMCVPRWHDDALFSGLMGGAGVFAVHPRGRFVSGGQYEPGGLIWRSRWVTDEGAIVESRDALARPAEPARAVLLRRVCGRRGRCRVVVELAPAGPWGAPADAPPRREDDGTWTARAGAAAWRLHGAADATPTADGLRLELEAGEDEHHDLVLVVGADDGRRLPPADEFWDATERAWGIDVPQLRGMHTRRDARLACAVMQGLTTPGGGMVAAVTTGLPERADRGRDYDYRYVWVRDQCYAGHAAVRAGVDGLAAEAVAVVGGLVTTHGPGLAPAYTVTGDPVPEPRELPVPGYPGGTPQAGNRARDQFQLDVFGEALLLLTSALRTGAADGTAWRAVETAAAAIAERHDEPDAGVWELAPARWAHSRLVGAAGLRAAAELSLSTTQADRWIGLADRLLADAARHPSGRFQRHPGDGRVDASLLLGGIRGVVPPGGPTARATRAAVGAELTEDGYVYRYRAGGGPLGTAEGAFVICSFWMALAAAAENREREAIAWFERGRSACGPAGLFSEEFDVLQRQLRGNLPQAFVHALLLETSATLPPVGAAGQAGTTSG